MSSINQSPKTKVRYVSHLFTFAFNHFTHIDMITFMDVLSFRYQKQ